MRSVTKNMNFILFRNDGTKEESFPSAVTDDCYVSLKESDNKLEYILCEDPFLPDEIKLTSEIGKKLNGKRLGSKITIDGKKWQLESIMSKYTFAFHESMDILRTRYQSVGFKQFTHSADKSPEENLAPIFTMIDEQDLRQKDMNQFYKRGEATVGIMAKHFNENPIRYWQRLISNDDLGINWYRDHENIQLIGGMLEQNIGVILDITAIL